MTISTTATRAAYTGNGVTTIFSIPFAYLAVGEIAVYLDGVLQSVGYTVSAAPAASGTVTFSSAPATGVAVVITRATVRTQQIDYVANDPFAADVTEGGFDRAMLAIQDNAAGVARSLRAPDYADAVAEFDLVAGAGRLVGVKSDGSGFEPYNQAAGSFVAATETQAKEGQLDTVVMTPLRHAQAVQVQNVWAARAYGIYAGMANPAAAINSLMASVAAAGGGDVVLNQGTYTLEAPIDNQYTGVIVRGCREDKFHDGGNNIPLGTIIRTASHTFRALRLRSPYGASNSRQTGGGFTKLRVIGSHGVEVDSYSSGIMDVYLEDCEGDATFPYAAVFKCGIEGTDLAETCTVQDMDVHLYIRQLGAGAPQSYNGSLLTGSINANVCFNRQLRFVGQMHHGDFLTINSADNCTIELRCGTSGTGKALVAKGATAAHPVGAQTNTYYISANAAIILQGTDTPGVTDPANGMLRLDFGNGTPVPTLGTGCSAKTAIYNDEGVVYYERHVQLVGGAGFSEAVSARARIGPLDSCMMHNGSGAFFFGKTNGTRDYGERINADDELEFMTRQSAGAFYFTRPIRAASYAKAALPSAALVGQMIYVTDDVGGAVLAFSDGTNWLRVTDRAVVS